MRNIEFVPSAFEEYLRWIDTDRRTAHGVHNLFSLRPDRFRCKDKFPGMIKYLYI